MFQAINFYLNQQLADSNKKYLSEAISRCISNSRDFFYNLAKFSVFKVPKTRQIVQKLKINHLFVYNKYFSFESASLTAYVSISKRLFREFFFAFVRKR